MQKWLKEIKFLNRIKETNIKWGRRGRSVNTENILMEHMAPPPTECENTTSCRLWQCWGVYL